MNSEAFKSHSTVAPQDDELTDDDLEIISGGVTATTTTCASGSYPAKLNCGLNCTCSGNPATCTSAISI